MTTPLLKIRGLCKDFMSGGIWGERVRVLEDIDMEVQPGEIRGVVGESGSGKTTLARCSLRLLEPSLGAVEFDGQDLASLSPAALRARRREFQMVFQDLFASLNPEMPVEDILLEPLQVHRIGDRESRSQRIRELLNDVSLNESLIRRQPAELSGGQQQRVGIARGLALKPRLLVADEPVSALDVSVQAQILNLLAGLQRRYGLTLILISHSLYAVHYLCTVISVMYQGRIIEEAPATVFFKGPRHPYSRILLDAMPVLDPLKRDRTRAGRKEDQRPLRGRQGCSFRRRCPHAFAVCSERTPHLTEIQPGEKVACFLYI
jgi:peptide/nickel transport system ATP-binding protein